MIWRAIIQNYGGHTCLAEALDLSSLAKISDGYSAGHIEKSVSTVLTERRVQQVRINSMWTVFVSTDSFHTQLHRKPLTASEFIAPLSKIEPIYAEEEGAFKVKTEI